MELHTGAGVTSIYSMHVFTVGKLNWRLKKNQIILKNLINIDRTILI